MIVVKTAIIFGRGQEGAFLGVGNVPYQNGGHLGVVPFKNSSRYTFKTLLHILDCKFYLREKNLRLT